MDAKKFFLAAALAAMASLAVGQVDPMIDPATGQSYPRGTATFIPPGSFVSGQISQSDIDAIADTTIRADAQWRFNKAHEFQSQSDGIERETDLNSRGKKRTLFSPQKLTAADCMVGRHWELVGGLAACVCNGDLTHTAVSNDQPAACVAPPPPPPPPVFSTSQTENNILACPSPQTGFIYQTRTVFYTNGAPTSATPWATTSDTCVAPPPPPPAVCSNGAPDYPTCTPTQPVISYAPESQVLACVAPDIGSGRTQTRINTYTNGVLSAYGSWTTVSNDCNYLPPPLPNPLVWFYFPGGCGMDSARFQIRQSQMAAYLDWSANIDGPLCYADGNGMLSYHGSRPGP